MDVFTFDNISINTPLPTLPQFNWGGGQSPRLNVVLPNFIRHSPSESVLTAMALVKELSAAYPHIRFISQEALGTTEDMFDFATHVKPLENRTIEVISIVGGPSLPIHRYDVFFCMHWSSVFLWKTHADLMASHGLKRTPFYYFIQDFEPGSVPFSTTYGLILSTYNFKPYTHAIINSLELGAFLRRQGFSFAKTHVLKPSINPTMATWLQAQRLTIPAKPASPYLLVVYSRPNLPCNAFDAAMAGCKEFIEHLSAKDRNQLRIVSVGDHHPHIDLNGTHVRSLGWLGMQSYINLLSTAHMGLSLMISPHPSYIPLEMATMGLHTVTNAFYPGKDLTGNHPLLLSVTAPDPKLIAERLLEAYAITRSQSPEPSPMIMPASLSSHSREYNITKLKIDPILPS